MTKGMLRLRWDKAREMACEKAIEQGDPTLAAKIGGFQLRDIRPKAASEIVDIGDASLLLGTAVRKSQSALTEGSAPLRSRQNRKVMERFHKNTSQPQPPPRNTKAPHKRGFYLHLGGKPGTRTLGTLLTFADFQGWRFFL